MFRRRITQFFWLSAGLGLMAILTNAVHHKKNVASIEKEEPTVAELKAAKADLVAQMIKESLATGQPVLSETGKMMAWKGKTYVKIESQWFEERADHTYNVNGVKTYFIDNSRVGIESSERRVARAEPSKKTTDEKATELLQKMSVNPFSAYSADQVSAMMQTVQAAKNNAEERDKALKELSKAE